jgi:hypothetical protein
MLLLADCATHETPAIAKSRRSDKLNQTRVGNFSHSEKAELLPEFVAFNMGPLGNGGYMLHWMLIAVLLLAGSSP